MTLRTETNKVSGKVFVLWIIRVKAKSIILYLLVQNIVHELSALGTVDGGVAFLLRICTFHFREIDDLERFTGAGIRFIGYFYHPCSKLCITLTATPWIWSSST